MTKNLRKLYFFCQRTTSLHLAKLDQPHHTTDAAGKLGIPYTRVSEEVQQYGTWLRLYVVFF